MRPAGSRLSHTRGSAHDGASPPPPTTRALPPSRPPAPSPASTFSFLHPPLSAVGSRRERCPVQFGPDGTASILAIPQARSVPSFRGWTTFWSKSVMKLAACCCISLPVRPSIPFIRPSVCPIAYLSVAPLPPSLSPHFPSLSSLSPRLSLSSLSPQSLAALAPPPPSSHHHLAWSARFEPTALRLAQQGRLTGPIDPVWSNAFASASSSAADECPPPPPPLPQ